MFWWFWAIGNVLSLGVIVFILQFLGFINVGGIVSWCALAIGLAGIIMTWGHRPPFASRTHPEPLKVDKKD